MKKISSIAQVNCLLFSIGAFVFISIVRLQLGYKRYFDPDEYMYLNWAYHVTQGYVPYRDFMMFAGPFYVYMLSPIMFLLKGIEPILVARLFSWFLSIVLALVLALWQWRITKSWIAIVAAITLLFFPMPSDKLLEIRPDITALIFLVLGLITLPINQIKPSRPKAFASGLWFGLSLITLQKNLPLIITIFLYVLLQKNIKRAIVSISFMSLGVFLIGAMFLVWAWLHQSVWVSIYSVTQLAIEHVQQVARFNPHSIQDYFSPNSAYYGESGVSLGLIANKTIWIISSVYAVTTLILGITYRFKSWNAQTLPALLLLVSLASYLWISPLKFSQYLLPASVFIAWFWADLMRVIWTKLVHTRMKLILSSVLFCGLLLFMVSAFWFSHKPKFIWDNVPALKKMTALYETIPKNAYVFDLEGRTLYYPYPYYACCLALGQFDSLLFDRYPTLRESLKQTKTKYIYQAEIPRINALGIEDQSFVKEHYTPTVNGELWVAIDW